MEPYYPINDLKKTELYTMYKEITHYENNVIFGGRLGLYQYLDMDQVISKALKCVERLVY